MSASQTARQTVMRFEGADGLSFPAQAVEDLVRQAQPPDAREMDDILEQARALAGLDPEQVAALLRLADPEARARVLATARQVKEGIYGRRMVLFAPLYASNECSNNCLYCAFRRDNRDLARLTLSREQIVEETRELEAMGHKRVLLVVGESARTGAEYVAQAVEAIYSTRVGRGEIRRVNVNMAPLSVDDFRVLKQAGIGTYQCFQETYHPDRYREIHPSGRKADYAWRLQVIDRAFAAGIDDVGLGVLFGLHDLRFDVLALLVHAAYLDERYGVGPHTLSFPRIEPAQNAPAAEHPPAPVSDEDLLLAVAVLRLAVPYTGLIMSTRETPALRRQLLGLGVSQLSAGSRTYPGAYADGRAHVEASEQFAIGDTRSLDAVVRELCDCGYVPSFCTSCYRQGRTGERFMGMAKPGEIKHLCTANGLLTFLEYLLDYASEETRAAGERVIAQALEEVAPALRPAVGQRLASIREGQRDLYL